MLCSGAEPVGDHEDLEDEEMGAERLEGCELLERIEVGAPSASVTLASGRRYELNAGDDRDTLVVRGRDGRVVLRLGVDEQGPVLEFDSASVTLRARDELALRARRVIVDAEDHLALRSRGDVRTESAGHHHTVVGGQERLEAKSVAVQADAGDVRIQAMHRVALDGELVALNDDPCPSPFAWSKASEDDDA